MTSLTLINQGIMARLEKEAASRSIPIIGPEVGRFIGMLVKSAKARSALELGTSIAYATIYIAKSLYEKGRVFTVEANPTYVEEARRNLRTARVRNVEVLAGDARNVVRTLNEKFDFIFLDIMERHYLEVLEPCLNLLNKNGLVVAYNTSREGVRDYNTAVCANPNLYTIILPLKEGLTISLKE